MAGMQLTDANNVVQTIDGASVGGNLNHYHRTGKIRKTAAVALTCAAEAYSDGDSIGTGFFSLTTAARESGGSFTIKSITVADKAKQSSKLSFLFFTDTTLTSTLTAGGALTLTDADLLKCAGAVTVAAADYVALADNSVACEKALDLPITLSGTTTLTFCVVCQGTPTYVSTADLQAIFQLEQD